MKKLLLFVILLFVGVGSVSAQSKHRIDRYWNERAGYLNISFVNQKLKTEIKNKNTDLLKNNWGVALSYGRSFYLHQKPIADMVKIGLDWTWLDINLAGYSMDEGYFAGGDSYGNLFQGELGMQFGPSVSVNPVDDLKVSFYMHVTPTYAIFRQADIEITLSGLYFQAIVHDVCKVPGAGVQRTQGSVGMQIHWLHSTIPCVSLQQ